MRDESLQSGGYGFQAPLPDQAGPYLQAAEGLHRIQRTAGPLPRFAQMIKGPQYRMLLNHHPHEVREVSRTDEEAVFAVTITTRAGDFVGYQWTVAKVSGGEHDGAWMTIAVSPPVPVGQAI